jgi:hypothetical protein
MAKNVVVFKGGGMPQTEEETQQVMAAWGAWFGQLGEAVVDPGNPFGPSMSVGADGSVTEGAASSLTGYVILEAESVAAAAEMATSCPILASGGSIEVYETFEVM